MPLPRAHSQRQVHAGQPNRTRPPPVSASSAKSASAATSPRSASAASNGVSPGSAKSPPSTEYVKSRLAKLYMSPKASKIPTLQQPQHAAVRTALSPIASPAADKRALLPHLEPCTEPQTRSQSSSPSVSLSASLNSRTDPTSMHGHSPLLAPLPSSLSASPVRSHSSTSLSQASVPAIAAPSASSQHLPLPSGPLLPDHLSPRWVDWKKDEQDEEHKENDAPQLGTASHSVQPAVRPVSPLLAPSSPSPSQPLAPASAALSVPPFALPVVTSSASAASADSSTSSARTLQHSVSLPPVLEGERESSHSEARTERARQEKADAAQQVLRSASLPLSIATAAPSPPLPPPAVPAVTVDTSAEENARGVRHRGSSVTRIERLVSPTAADRAADQPSASNDAIPEGDEAVESVPVPATARLSIDATSPTDSAAVADAAPLSSTRGGRHNSIEGAGDGDYPLSPFSAAQAFDTLAAQNTAVALLQPQFNPMSYTLQQQQLMPHVAQPYLPPHMAGFAPALAAHPYAMHPAYALSHPAMPGLPMPMHGMPYGAHPMDPHYQYLLMQQHQQQQHQAMMAAQLEPPRSYSSASYHAYSPAPATLRSPAHSISYTPQPQLRYAPTPTGLYPQPPATFAQSRLSLASSPSPVPSGGSGASGLTDTQARLAFFRDVANNRHADVKEQLERGMPPSATDRNGNTPLHVACQHGLRRIVKSLLRVGADINAANREGNTPLHMCYAYHYEELGDYLKSKGANDRKLNSFGMSCYDGLKPASEGPDTPA